MNKDQMEISSLWWHLKLSYYLGLNALMPIILNHLNLILYTMKLNHELLLLVLLLFYFILIIYIFISSSVVVVRGGQLNILDM